MTSLVGKKIMLLEDEAIIAFAVEDMLSDLGCIIVGPALRLDQGLELAAGADIDAAILDVNINSDRSYPVADALDRRGVPFMFATGYDREGLEWRGAEPPEIIGKPYRREQLEAALQRLLG
jgi:CheY-like chemotaxis protein